MGPAVTYVTHSCNSTKDRMVQFFFNQEVCSSVCTSVRVNVIDALAERSHDQIEHQVWQALLNN
jgi:hypothetical protein